MPPTFTRCGQGPPPSAAGGGDPKKAPFGLVAVIGDSRLRHWGGVSDVSFSPDGKKLASASSDTVVKVWDLTGPGMMINMRAAATPLPKQ